IIIPAYKSDDTIGSCIESVKRLDYPRKEIIVINDSRDRTPEICRKLRVRCIQNRKRLGKPGALNEGIKHSRGEILFLIDADTIASRDVIKKCIAWFHDKKTAAVMPGYRTSNRKGFAKLVSIENSITLALVRMNLFFGSMLGYRGCGVLMRKSVVKKLGGFPSTLMEDNDFSARIIKAGYRIRFEPSTSVMTREPENLRELGKQKMRWGKGALFTFLRHHDLYMKSPQFLLYFFPYIFLGIVVSLTMAYNVFLILLHPSLSGILSLITMIVLLTLAAFVHILVLLGNERSPASILLFILLYTPVVCFFYTRGILSGIKAKREKKPELDLSDW
ncbi:MAG TPA: glycosyltransferase family 2 protein, partial [Candidatus Aenigmarchaeota archaeon]|nr:glycosyltransferase family 2 protein [Candidatus Aenigmarchaeota archaeon]